MAASSRGTAFWAPRLLTIVFALFLSVFALDVFEGDKDAGRLILELGLHLIPTFAILAVLALAWRWELVGTAAFAGLSVAYIVSTGGRFALQAYLVISGSLLLLALLFLNSWLRGRRRPPARR
jgi:hypothetical protein